MVGVGVTVGVAVRVGVAVGVGVGLPDTVSVNAWVLLAHISILSCNYETSDRRKRQCLLGCERGEGVPEVNTQWVRNKIGPFSSLSTLL